jgi:hypothetical protein
MKQRKLHANIQIRKQNFARNEANKIAHKDTIRLHAMKQATLHAKEQYDCAQWSKEDCTQ